MSMVARLLALIAGMLVLVAGVEAYNGLSLRQSRLGELRDDTTQLANTAGLQLAGILEGTRQLLATIAKLSDKHGWDDRACSILTAAASSDLEYDHIVAVDRDGIIRCSSSGASRIGAAMPDEDLLDRIVASAGFSVGSYGVGAASGNGVLRVGYPVVDDAGRVVGAVYAGINVSWLNTAISQWKLGEEVSISAADRNGILIGGYPELTRVGEEMSARLTPLLHSAAPGIVAAPGIDGTDRLFGYIPLDVEPSKGIAIFVGRNFANVLAGINRSIWLNVLTLIAALLISVLATLVYVRRYVARPFGNLLAVAARWRGGDWSARAGNVGIPEFDRLASAFDAMATEVSARDLDLRYRDAISRAITECAAELVTTSTIKEAIPRILKTMGEALKVDRIIVLEDQSAGSALTLHDAWHGPGATFELGANYFALQPSVEPPDITEWLKPLRAGGIVAATRSDVRGAAREMFDAVGMAANLQARIKVDGEPWGQLGVDDCRVERSWTAAEMDAVTVLADLIGAAIARARHLEKLSNADEVVRKSPAIVYRLSTDVRPARMTYISDNVSLLGNSAAELTTDPGLYLAKIYPDDRNAVETALMAVDSDVPPAGSMEFRIADANGAYRWVEDRYQVTRDDQGRAVAVAGVLMDVTVRRAAEEKLRFANNLLTTLRETSPDAILVIDADMRIISFNRQFRAMWRLPADLVEGASDAATLAAVAAMTLDPEAFHARVRHLYAHPEESAHEEIQTVDGRLIDRDTAALRGADGAYLGRVLVLPRHNGPTEGRTRTCRIGDQVQGDPSGHQRWYRGGRP